MESGLSILKGNLAKLATKLTTETADIGAPSWYTAGLRSVVSDALDALGAVDTARGSLETIGKDPNTSDALKARRLAEGMTHAEGVARSYVATASKAADALKARLDRELIPTRPEGVSDSLLLDRKADLTALLDGEETAADKEVRAMALAREAIRQGDALTMHVLAGGPLAFYYARRKVDPAALTARLVTLDGSPTATLLGRFRGPESVPAVVTMATHAVDMALGELGMTYRPMIDTLNARAAKA